jgi:hypothetical protein
MGMALVKGVSTFEPGLVGGFLNLNIRSYKRACNAVLCRMQKSGAEAEAECRKALL